MKNIKKILLTISIFLGTMHITNVKALSIDDFENNNEVKNSVSASITKDEYLKLRDNYSDLLIDTFARDSIDSILNDDGIVLDEYIATTTYSDNRGNIISSNDNIISEESAKAISSKKEVNMISNISDISPNEWNVKISTTYKRLIMTINKDSDLYNVRVYNEWLKMPTVKHYDVIASRWEGNAIYRGGIEGVQNVKLKNGTTDFSMYNLEAGFDHIVHGNKGVGITMNLYDDATEIVNSMSYLLSNASKSKIIGTYQHATSNAISLSQATSYKFTSNGLGGCIWFNTSDVNNKYDRMKGVYYILP
ncbi:MAG TPA: hypothetical protein DHU33_05015 [Firmicutes bacterium]|nr:hypothetical protein [Bacillota bacterium]